MREYNLENEIALAREYKVVKSNEIIQKAYNQLNASELKCMAFIFSKIKPTDVRDTWYKFSIKEYCQVVGIDSDSGKNYANVKATLQKLRNTSFWLLDEHGKERTVGWLDKATINRGSGNVGVRLDEDLQKYVLGLIEGNYTQYTLLSCLPMQSAYSIKCYELLKSYAFAKKHVFDIDELKRLLGATHLSNFKDFRRRVLEKATEEINLYTDIEVSWEPISKGKKVIQVIFYISQRDTWGVIEAEEKAKRKLDDHKQVKGQMNLDFDNPEPAGSDGDEEL